LWREYKADIIDGTDLYTHHSPDGVFAEWDVVEIAAAKYNLTISVFTGTLWAVTGTGTTHIRLALWDNHFQVLFPHAFGSMYNFPSGFNSSPQQPPS